MASTRHASPLPSAPLPAAAAAALPAPSCGCCCCCPGSSTSTRLKPDTEGSVPQNHPEVHENVLYQN
jgi:hypothetical protein